MRTTADLRNITSRLASELAGGPLGEMAAEAAATAAEVCEVLESAGNVIHLVNAALGERTLVDLRDSTPALRHLG